MKVLTFLLVFCIFFFSLALHAGERGEQARKVFGGMIIVLTIAVVFIAFLNTGRF